jgi:uncharacterized protein YggE
LIRSAAGLLALFVFALPGSAQQLERIPSISVTGEGVVMAEPDLAIVAIGVVSRGETAREALSANNSDMERVVEAISRTGVEPRDIGTTGFYINPVYDSPPPPRPGEAAIGPRVIGYEVTNEVTVRIRNLATSGAVLDEVVTAGANRVHSIQFDIDEKGRFEEEAIALAIGDARRKAEIMAEAAGVRLTRVLAVSISNYMPPPPMFAERAVAMSAPAPDVPILGGERSITATANMEWEIAPE